MRFARLAEYFDLVEATTSRIRLTEILADLLRETSPDEVDKIIYLGQGRLVPPFEQLEFGVGEAMVREALVAATGATEAEIRERFRELGDYGSVARALLADKPEGDASVTDVYDALYCVAMAGGKGAQAQKRDLLVALLGRLGPGGAKHAIRIVLGRLRLGVGDPTYMEALSYWRTGGKAERAVIERAYNLCSDLGLVARVYMAHGPEGLAGIHVEVGKPVRPAMAERENTPQAIITRLGRCAAEPKIDGFRVQVHKADGRVRAFSRNLEDMSTMFPEIVEGIGEITGRHRVILEGEAAGYDPNTLEFFPFQVTVQRKRKYNIDELRRTLPLKLVAFDLLYLDGKDLTPLPYAERRRALLDLLGPPIDLTVAQAPAAGPVIQPNEAREFDDAAALEAYFAAVVERGQEGIVAKRLDAPYQAGARNFNWIKLKRSYQGQLRDTVDCVITGYWYGKGNRAKLGIGALLTAVYDPERDVFTTVTRLGSGFSEEQWRQLRQLLDQIRTAHRPARVESLLEPDVWCEPKYVVEVQADEITRSPMHTTGRRNGELGYALRFPRAVGFLREDRRPEDATTVKEIIDLYRKQGQKALPE
jgi:DNA ligase-1